MKIDIEGILIDYETKGTGRDVLLLHGWGCDKEIFKSVEAGLGKTMRVTALDFPGFGKSGRAPDSFGIGDYARVTAEFIKKLKIEGTDIICHSFGGRVAILLGAKYPEIVGKIVFAASAGLRKKRTLKYYFRIYRYKLLKKIAKTKFLNCFFKKLGIDAAKHVKNAGSADYRALDEHMRRVFVRVINEDLKKYLRFIKAPSLLIWGENDKETPVSYGKIMERKISDSGLVILPNAGHYVFLDQYERFMVIAKHFLGGLKDDSF